MRELNPYAQINMNGLEIQIVEEWIDSAEDGNFYTLGYFSTFDGQHAQAFCLENPFDASQPNRGESYAACHCAEDGNICLGERKHRGDLEDSEYTLKEAVLIARFWCTAFTHFRQTGYFPQP